MMEARGFALEEREGEELKEPEITRSYDRRARGQGRDRSGGSFDLGDVAGAVEAYRELYRELLDYGPSAGTPA